MINDIFQLFGERTDDILFEIITECMDDYLYIFDLQNNIFEISQSAVKRFNIPSNILTDMSNEVMKVVYEGDREMLAKHLADICEGREKVHNLHYRWLDKNVVIRFLGPLKNYKEANNNSLVVQLAYGKNRFLFMGDAEEKAEEDMIKENYDLECDVLKVGHHGSYTATGDNFLTKADPAYAVISAGKDNSYGHPHAATLAKLEDDDVQIYRTDTMGTIEAVSDGNQIHMETEKGKTNE